jgi:hypothetical protein
MGYGHHIQISLNGWNPTYIVSLYFKGFIIVYFNSPEGRRKLIEEGPWLQGKFGMFFEPWFSMLIFQPHFDVHFLSPFWVRLLNLLLYLWEKESLDGIGNSLCKFIKLYPS